MGTKRGDPRSEGEEYQRVFVTAVYVRVIRQGHDPLKRSQHLCMSAG